MSDVSCEEVQALKTNLLLLLVQKWRLKEILNEKKKKKNQGCLLFGFECGPIYH